MEQDDHDKEKPNCLPKNTSFYGIITQFFYIKVLSHIYGETSLYRLFNSRYGKFGNFSETLMCLALELCSELLALYLHC